jgi:hypothetical protein
MADLSLFQDYLNNTQIPDQNNSFSFSLPQGFETNYEDVAGLKQLPLQRMLKQIGRPLNKLYEEIQEAKESFYPYSKQEIKRLLQPNPARTEKILNRAQAVEKVRQSWNPIDVEWQERLNKWNPNPRSKPAQADFNTFANVVRNVSHSAFTELNNMPGPTMYGLLGDISDYLNPNQLNIIKQGVKEQLNQGIPASKIIYEGKGGNKNTGRANVKNAVEKFVNEFKGSAPGSPQEKNSQEWLQRYMNQTDPPLIIPGVEQQFKGV